MIDFSTHAKIMVARNNAIQVDEDRREIMHQCNIFVTKKDGQWEDNVLKLFTTYKRPRYTLDLCRPVIDSIYGELTQNEFNIVVKPMSSGASKEVSKIYAGLIKNSENLSNAVDTYNLVAKKAITTGFACFRIDQDWCDSDAFDQDLFITPIHDAIDRVWFLGNYQKRTAADADGVTVDHLVSEDEYKERFGDEPPQSIDDTTIQNREYYKRQGIRISELSYKIKVKKTLYQFPDGMVLGEEDALNTGVDLSTVKTRTRDSYEIKVVWYDGKRILTEPEDTVFSELNIIPVLPNFEIVDDKPISSGAIEWLMDWQRIRNYAGSKKVEDVALLPRQRLMMTKKQGAGHEGEHATMNTSNRAVDHYNVDPEAPPPYIPGQVMPNPGANELLMQSQEGINTSSGVFPASMGGNPALQSGIAIDKIQNKGDVGKLEYYNAMQAALTQAGKVCIGAFKKLLDTKQERRIVKEDGTYDMVTLNETDLNGNKINDLSKGIYDVVCDIGPAFRNRQEKTVEQIVSLGQYDPTLIPQGKDILLNNIDAPGMDLLAERARASLMKMGEIPESQWTDEEKQQAEAAQQAASQNQAQDPNLMIAQAELEKAHAKTSELEISAIKLQQTQQKMDFEQQQSEIKDSIDGQKKMAELLNVMADTLNKISASMGADTIVSPDAAQAYQTQAQNIEEVQAKM
jgi:hypothetical protein